tara:strand:+ start:306 stop:578 length:273 start_codon:yes stop_codon:yes gene_type:complete
MKYIDPYYFLIALCVGILMVYLFTNQPKIVMKYPTPDNIKNTVYKDKNDVCYKYTSEEVSCKNNKYKEIELQNGVEENILTKFKKYLNIN